jgi:pilus assembly protein CpaB
MTSMMIKPARSMRANSFRIGGLLAVVLASGALAVAGAQTYLERELERQRVASIPPAAKTLGVVVAKFPLERGELISSDNMAIRQVPAEFIPASTIQPDQFEALSGMRLARAMRSGEPLLREALLEAGPEPLAMRLAPGKRAVTIMADEVNSVSGMLRPGDRVDLLFTARDVLAAAQGSGGDLTRPLLQDVRILATGAQLDTMHPRGPGAASFGTVTVEVTPEQAKQLVLAQRGGRLTAMLRGPDDRFAIGSGTLEFAELLGRGRSATAAQPPVPVPAPVQRPAMEIIVGGIGRSAQPASAQPVAAQPASAQQATAHPAAAQPATVPAEPSRGASPSVAVEPSRAALSPAVVEPSRALSPSAAVESSRVSSPAASAAISSSAPPVHRAGESGWPRMMPVAAEPQLIR